MRIRWCRALPGRVPPEHPTVPDAIAALLPGARARTGAQPHVRAEWTGRPGPAGDRLDDTPGRHAERG